MKCFCMLVQITSTTPPIVLDHMYLQYLSIFMNNSVKPPLVFSLVVEMIESRLVV